MTEGDLQLIKRAQEGDIEAFCSLAASYQRRIYSLALQYCHNAQDAEDLSQEVWLKSYQALGSFRFESSFYTWLRRITINTFLKHQRARVFRERGRQTTVEFVTWDLSGNEGLEQCDSEGVLVNKVLLEKVKHALLHLSPKQRLVFLLKHQEGMTYDEIAGAIGCTTGTVKKAVARAIKKIRAQLETNTNESDLHCVSVEYGTGVCDAQL